MFLLLNIFAVFPLYIFAGIDAVCIPQLLACVWVLQRECSGEKYCFMSGVK